MSYDWGPHYIVPSTVSRTYSGVIRLRERLDEELLFKELEALGLPQVVSKISNPWYYRKKNTDTWIKIGESDDKAENFPVTWDTRNLENGDYEVLGLMHVFVQMQDAEQAIARQSIAEVVVEN